MALNRDEKDYLHTIAAAIVKQNQEFLEAQKVERERIERKVDSLFESVHKEFQLFNGSITQKHIELVGNVQDIQMQLAKSFWQKIKERMKKNGKQAQI